MKIAQVAPLFESVPPRLYGGTERVVSYLTDELVRKGHDVTLFATADSSTLAQLRPQSRRALRFDDACLDPIPDHMVMLEEVFKDPDEFDVIHLHTNYLHFPHATRTRVPTVTTLHGRLDLPHIHSVFQAFRTLPFASISNSQRGPMPWLNWRRTVYHGLPANLYRYVENPAPYLAFVGRISPEKRLDRAIDIAQRIGIKLRVAAKVDKADRDYFDSSIRPLLRDPLIEYVGEIGDRDKGAFIGDAMALLFPIDWPEPFGLVMIEAMACGTPVIAYPCGSTPEIIRNGQNGRLVESIDAAVEAVKQIHMIKRSECRAIFEERFTVSHMAMDYLELYAHLVEESHANRGESWQRRAGSLPRSSAVGLAG